MSISQNDNSILNKENGRSVLSHPLETRALVKMIRLSVSYADITRTLSSKCIIDHPQIFRENQHFKMFLNDKIYKLMLIPPK
jgi:hypothetical protein